MPITAKASDDQVRFATLSNSNCTVLSGKYKPFTMSTYHSSELGGNSNLIPHTDLSCGVYIALSKRWF